VLDCLKKLNRLLLAVVKSLLGENNNLAMIEDARRLAKREVSLTNVYVAF